VRMASIPCFKKRFSVEVFVICDHRNLIVIGSSSLEKCVYAKCVPPLENGRRSPSDELGSFFHRILAEKMNAKQAQDVTDRILPAGFETKLSVSQAEQAISGSCDSLR